MENLNQAIFIGLVVAFAIGTKEFIELVFSSYSPLMAKALGILVILGFMIIAGFIDYYFNS